MPTNPGYVEAEARVFGGYALSRAVHALSLAQPRLRLRAVEVGAGEPTVFLHGFSHCTAHWAPLVSRLSGMRSLMLDAPGHATADARAVAVFMPASCAGSSTLSSTVS